MHPDVTISLGESTIYIYIYIYICIYVCILYSVLTLGKMPFPHMTLGWIVAFNNAALTTQ